MLASNPFREVQRQYVITIYTPQNVDTSPDLTLGSGAGAYTGETQ
jgi:hypothetical protein